MEFVRRIGAVFGISLALTLLLLVLYQDDGQQLVAPAAAPQAAAVTIDTP